MIICIIQIWYYNNIFSDQKFGHAFMKLVYLYFVKYSWNMLPAELKLNGRHLASYFNRLHLVNSGK